MAKDVAQRDRDLAGFRIGNVADPMAEGDLTKVDGRSTPRANSGGGSPGTSFLAAAADHVHPAVGGAAAPLVTFDDPTQQSMTGQSEEVVSQFAFDFAELGTPQMTCQFAALVKVSAGTARFRLQVGGTQGLADGKELIGFSTGSPEFERHGAGGGPFETPAGLQVVKIVAATEQPDAVCHIVTKAVQFRGVS